ncbi:integrin alpha-PS2 isoform X2 [Ischnura elegans]|uniref:integrin alpha-PS2 isoform X2 n=1 Tax=Ischnura elegans TaxID=197161 RepID=UPI001ED8883B|nr:integrin alpha-PS2 isoform X2 [Ischnura elegans]
MATDGASPASASSSVAAPASRVVALALALAWGLAWPSAAFNVDTEKFVQHRGPSGSMFGFSVAEHRQNGSGTVLVGAPRGQTNQPGIRNGGAVYRCDLFREDSCDIVNFDLTGNNVKYNGLQQTQLDEKSGQWFGATVRSSGEDGPVVACAPRYVWFTNTAQRRDPVGTCYIAKRSLSEFSEYSPCRTIQWGYHRQGYCQAGLGAHVSRDGQRLFIGAVGSWYWQGQVYSQNLTSRPEVVATREGPATDDDSYLGYSVAVGDFNGKGEGGVVVGMPRGASLLGKVMILTTNLTTLQNLTGTQLGAYFGYSVCVADMDGDGLDDIIVGAPLYSDWDDNEGRYETGRIYVYYQKENELKKKFFKPDIRDGKNFRSRFGLAVTDLGDINRDNFQDVAVGAPYDGPTERGAVYIYHGSATGIKEKPSQIIHAETVNSLLTTFGFSLSGGMDLDDNEYPDLVVGAYESDTAVYFRTRPVVSMDVKLNFSSESKQISLEEKDCILRDYTQVACTTLNVCLEYGGVGVDRRLEFDVQYILDAKKTREPRMFFIEFEGNNNLNQTIRLDKGALLCRNIKVYIKPNIRDKLTPIEAELKYSIKKESGAVPASRRRRYLPAILDENAPPSQKDSISIQKNCGKDNICIPDLTMSTTPSVARYLLGSGQRLEFDVLVHNRGEDAFESTFNMKVPDGINYINIERLDEFEREIHVHCSAPSRNNNNTLRCDIGNPMPKDKLVHFKVLLQPFYRVGMKPRYEFQMSVNTTNPEDESTRSDNSKQFTIPIWVETELIIQGSSNPPEIHYNTTQYSEEKVLTHESEIGPQLFHTYSIRNKGPSDILEATAYILWPTYILGGEHLLYLLEQPETSGPIRCEPGPHVNELNLQLDRKKKSFLGSQRFTAEEMSGQGASVEVSEGGAKGGGGGSRKASSSHEVTSWEVSSENGGRVHTKKTSSSETRSSGGGKFYSSTSSWSAWTSSSKEESSGGGGREGRRKRAQSAEPAPEQSIPSATASSFAASDDDLTKALRCGPTNCTKYHCTIGPLKKDEEVLILMRSRVDVRTLKKLGAQNVNVSSVLVSQVTKLPQIGSPDDMHIRTHEIITNMKPTDGERDAIVPWWTVVLSACAGTIILMLLIFLLWKCGFFKRNRPSDAPEKEPLNRNGHFQPGDEAL